MPKSSKTTQTKTTGNADVAGREKNLIAPDRNVLVPSGATVESLVAQIVAEWAKGQDAEWTCGNLYNQLVEAIERGRGLHIAKLMAPIKDIGTSTLRRWGRVAKAFPEAVAEKYGVTKLEALLSYEQLAHVKPIEGDPAQVSIAVPQQDDSVKAKAFADCSLRELRAAIAHLHPHTARPGPTPSPKPLPPPPPNDAPSTTDEKRALDVLRSGIEASQGTHGAIQIRTRKGPRGLLVDLVGIPVNEVTHVLSTIVEKQLVDAVKKVPKVPGLKHAKNGKKR